VRSTELSSAVPSPASVIIPARALQELGRIIAEESKPVRMTIAPNRSQAYFRMTNVDLISQLVEGNFPDHKQIIPKSHTTRTVVDAAKLLNAVKIASFFVRDAAHVLKLQITPGDQAQAGKLTVNATSAELGDNVTEIEAAVEGVAIEIAFNAEYLMDVLGVLNSPQVVIETSSPSSPGVLKPSGGQDFIHVIMPMHIAR
jgi:DNA polymerase-3 subunit beta